MKLPQRALAAIDLAYRVRGMAVAPVDHLATLRMEINYRADGPYLDWGDYPVVVETPSQRFDEHGLPQIFRAGAWHYSPVTVTQFGLQEDARSRAAGADPVHASNARAAADWLVAWQEADSGLWPYLFEFPVGGMGVTLPGGWASAMAQGQAMSLLARVAERGADGPYLEAAVRGLPPFRTTVDEGGLTGYLDGHPIYEEFPTQPPSFALNGFQFALLGLYDLAQAPVASDAQELFDSGIASLVWALPKYDTGGLSAYHLGHLTHPPRRMHRSLYYHYIHIQLLRALHCASGNPELEQYARRWLAYKPRRFDPS